MERLCVAESCCYKPRSADCKKVKDGWHSNSERPFLPQMEDSHGEQHKRNHHVRA